MWLLHKHDRADDNRAVALTQHHQPLGLLHTVRVSLSMPQLGNVDLICFGNLIRSAMADEDGLASPLDNDLFHGGTVYS